MITLPTAQIDLIKEDSNVPLSIKVMANDGTADRDITSLVTDIGVIDKRTEGVTLNEFKSAEVSLVAKDTGYVGDITSDLLDDTLSESELKIYAAYGSDVLTSVVNETYDVDGSETTWTAILGTVNRWLENVLVSYTTSGDIAYHLSSNMQIGFDYTVSVEFAYVSGNDIVGSLEWGTTQGGDEYTAPTPVGNIYTKTFEATSTDFYITVVYTVSGGSPSATAYRIDDLRIEIQPIFAGFIVPELIQYNAPVDVNSERLVDLIVKDYQWKLENTSLAATVLSKTELTMGGLLPNINQFAYLYLFIDIDLFITDISVSSGHREGEFELRFYYDNYNNNRYLEWAGGTPVNVKVASGSIVLYPKDGELTNEYITLTIGDGSRPYITSDDKSDKIVIYDDSGLKAGYWHRSVNMNELIDDIETNDSIYTNFIGELLVDSLTYNTERLKQIFPCYYDSGVGSDYTPESMQYQRVTGDSVFFLAYKSSSEKIFLLEFNEYGLITETEQEDMSGEWISASEELIHFSTFNTAGTKYYIWTSDSGGANVNYLYYWSVSALGVLSSLTKVTLIDTTSAHYDKGLVRWSMVQDGDDIYALTYVLSPDYRTESLIKMDISTGLTPSTVESSLFSESPTPINSAFLLNDSGDLHYCCNFGVIVGDSPNTLGYNFYNVDTVAHTYIREHASGGGYYRGLSPVDSNDYFTCMCNIPRYSGDENHDVDDLPDCQIQVVSYRSEWGSLSGTVTTAAIQRINGTSTNFFLLHPGDYILIVATNEVYRVCNVYDSDRLYVDADIISSASGSAIKYRSSYIFDDLIDFTSSNRSSVYGSFGIGSISSLDSINVLKFTDYDTYEIVSSSSFKNFPACDKTFFGSQLFQKQMWAKALFPCGSDSSNPDFLIYQNVNPQFNLITGIFERFFQMRDEIAPYVTTADFTSIKDANSFFRKLAAAWVFLYFTRYELSDSRHEVYFQKRDYDSGGTFTITDNYVYPSGYSDKREYGYDAVTVGDSTWGDTSSSAKVLDVSNDLVPSDLELTMAYHIYTFVNADRDSIKRTMQLFYNLEQGDELDYNSQDWIVKTNSIDLKEQLTDIDAYELP